MAIPFALLACSAVPMAWRRMYALGVYTYLRPGELLELRWKDIDLTLGEVRVTRSLEWASGEVKSPKTYAGVRRVPLHAELLPLLREMREGKAQSDRVIEAPETDRSRFEYPRIFREHLERAGVVRTELFQESRTHVAINFRSLRDTGLTWSAIAGIDLVKLQRRAGHTTITMTLNYVKEAEDRETLTGSVFPSLQCLRRSLDQALDQIPQLTAEPFMKIVTPAGIEPALPT